MPEESLILWPRATWWDHAWNPMIGCRKCSPACQNCWAETWAKRFHQSFEPHPTKQKPPKKGVVFCGSLTDLFGEFVDVFDSVGFIAQCINAKADAYIWLTKRAGKMREALEIGQLPTDDGMTAFEELGIEFRNHYFGFTAENQKWFNIRVDAAAEIPLAFNQWLSAEPLLGPIDMGDMVEMFKWVVVGCESGPDRRPCKIEWVESIVEQCLAANVPVFVKQLDLNGKCETDINKFPEHLRIRQVPWTIVESK